MTFDNAYGFGGSMLAATIIRVLFENNGRFICRKAVTGKVTEKLPPLRPGGGKSRNYL